MSTPPATPIPDKSTFNVNNFKPEALIPDEMSEDIKREDDIFTTKVEFALNPGWVGGTQTRGMKKLPTDELLLTLSRAWPDGRVMNGWVKWRRS